jgi:hypothetical protein
MSPQRGGLFVCLDSVGADSSGFAFEPVYMGERMSHTVRDPRSE